ncbi:MAG TPA: IclR family transcriptional regulator [Actinomycetes bacterium]|nr:IclR family transcriptional regulator [Actinomycetes bacterium]
MEASKRGSRHGQALDHAIDVLECMAEAARPIGVTEIARQVGLSKATVHHLLATLLSRRIVMQDPHSSLYRLGWALYELGSSVVADIELSRVARTHLDRLAAVSGESVLLGILNGDTVLYLDRGDPRGGLHLSTTGHRGSLHATASGKVHLAFCGDPSLLDRVLGGPLARLTRSTVVDPETLRGQLRVVRSRGYATSWQEREVGVCSVAVPLRDRTGRAIGSLSLVGPAARLTPRTLPTQLSRLKHTASQIERGLGCSSAVAEG